MCGDGLFVLCCVVQMASCLLDNDGARGSCLWASRQAALHLTSCSVRGGARAGITLSDSELIAFFCSVRLRQLSACIVACVLVVCCVLCVV